MKCLLAIAALAIAAAISNQPAQAHGLEWQRAEAGATVSLQFGFGADEPAAFAAVTLIAPDDKVPFQIGRTDGNGHFAFRPDRTGAWQVKVDDGDGHHLQFALPVIATTTAATAGKEHNLQTESTLRLALLASLLGNLALLLWLRWRPHGKAAA